MEKAWKLDLQPIKDNDVEALTEIMTRSFDNDALVSLGEDKGGPEGYDTGEFIRRWALESPSESFKVLLDGRIVGAVIVFIHENNENFLGNLFVDPALQSQGVGLSIWEAIEREYLDTKKWTTETPGFSRRNNHFYVNKCGFKIVRIENARDAKEASYVMEKEMSEVF
ncbi:GNAT family N-acetyltransferase [Paenibacillus rhizophilus]|uniref:N-acetyltransferase n=1 Tax=Paenibacillus rhizophilus TaxID=1850366 RepID=A0A3N9P894_9BACL|nr:GNAT family N-acetyltransferase [Paenibacillus rhizophilus]RQW11557.1 N-acetyltransferase [Paenibacillus rhizophilus]